MFVRDRHRNSTVATAARCSPGVFLDADLFRDGQWQNDDEAHDEEGKSLVSVPVIGHFPLSGTSDGFIQRNTHWTEEGMK